jgi:general secretion pathway protein H
LCRAHELQRGFTLLELIVVLTVVGLVMAFGFPSFFGSGSALDTRREITLLANELRQARRAAMTSAAGAGVEFDMAHRLVRNGGGAPRGLPPGLSISVTTARSQLRGDHAAGVWFFPDGSSSGGRVSIADGRHTYWIDIDWVTGRVATSAQ